MLGAPDNPKPRRDLSTWNGTLRYGMAARCDGGGQDVSGTSQLNNT